MSTRAQQLLERSQSVTISEWYCLIAVLATVQPTQTHNICRPPPARSSTKVVWCANVFITLTGSASDQMWNMVSMSPSCLDLLPKMCICKTLWCRRQGDLWPFRNKTRARAKNKCLVTCVSCQWLFITKIRLVHPWVRCQIWKKTYPRKDGLTTKKHNSSCLGY